jgi:hypothetical protein
LVLISFHVLAASLPLVGTNAIVDNYPAHFSGRGWS